MIAPNVQAIIDSDGAQESVDDILTAKDRVRVYTNGMFLLADAVTRNNKTGKLTATGNVFFENLLDGHKMACDLAEYDLNTESGTFFNVRGSAPAQIDRKPGLLTTTNPFYFVGEKAEATKGQYVLYNGFVTDCKPDDVWWRLKAKKFDIKPHDRAISKQSILYLKKVPIFYFPIFRKSLEENPRKSGFLTPNIGNSSVRGQTVGLGYFWAINRSYDLTYRTQYYTKRGFAHQADFSGWVNSRTTFDVSLFGLGGNKSQNAEGGYVLTAEAKSTLGRGWEGRGELRQLSSLAFRQSFTQSFVEAINSETHSTGLLTKHWNDYAINFVAQRNVNYQSAIQGEEIVTRKLPEAQFLTREHAIGKLPIWVSLDSSFGLERRSQPAFQTRQFVQRGDVAPRVMTAVHWKGIDIAPSFLLRETFYDSSMHDGRISGENLVRSARDVRVDFALPTIARVFNAPKWLRAGDKVKHVVEARAKYRYVTGINDFQQTIRFDELDVMSNTHEVEYSLTNRLLKRNGAGGVEDVISWQVLYKRYFDPTFGGAVIPNRRNVVESSDLLTGYAFLNGYRRQSPVVSILRIQSRVGVEWRTDFDPDRKSFVNSSVSIDALFGKLFILANHSHLRTDPVLAPNANQVRGQIQYGGDNQRGWSYGMSAGYDYLKASLQFIQSQVTYNTDCCGFSVQYRRNNFQVFNDNQFRVAFAIANIGSFGTLRRQERIF
ncbi:MAG: putative LPS assembly protein LptD [Bryobacteraceae bacterium]